MGIRPFRFCAVLILGIGLLLAGCGEAKQDGTAANRAERSSREKQRRLTREVGTRVHLDRADCHALDGV